MECLIQTTVIGNILRVTAIDTASLTEVVFQAPANTPPSRLRDLALQKLRYVIAKQQGQKN